MNRLRPGRDPRCITFSLGELACKTRAKTGQTLEIPGESSKNARAMTNLLPSPAASQIGLTVPDALPLKRAFLYLRVSTPRQARKNGEAEGYSIPQQREYCRQKARELGAEVVGEYIDAGESARTAGRPQLQQMLADVAGLGAGVDYVIVHKLDRLARNRVDDVQIVMAIQEAGATLVSVSELIDETPSGKLMHAILAGFAEYYSSNLSNESKKGMAQKARNGGPHGVAPIGYTNTLARVNGQEVKGIQLDEERAPHIAWAFRTYATGDWSISTLRDALEERGLRSRVTQKYRGTPLSDAQVHRFLKNPYYIGKIVYQGTVLPGAHEPLIDEKTWFHCQDLLARRRISGDRSWKMNHPLKGSLRCARCGGRMGYGKSRGKGGEYEYFFCLGRHTGRTTCDLPYIAVEKAEDATLQEWYSKGLLTSDEVEEARAAATRQLDEYLKDSAENLARQQARLVTLERKKQKLIDAYLDDAISGEDLKPRQMQVEREIADAKGQLLSAEDDRAQLFARLETVLNALEHAARVYERGNEERRRSLNQALFDYFEIDLVDKDGETLAQATFEAVARVNGALSAPVAAIAGLVPGKGQLRAAAALQGGRSAETAGARHAETPGKLPLTGGSNVTHLAVTVGFEPSLQANGCWCDQRDPRDSAEVGHMCAHLKTGSYRNSVTAALPLGTRDIAGEPIPAAGSARCDQMRHRAPEGLQRAYPVRPALPVSSSRTALRSRPR